MAKTIPYPQANNRREQLLANRYLGKKRIRNPSVSLSDRIGRMLIEKRLPEQVLAVLQSPTSSRVQKKELIQRVFFDNYSVSRVFGIKDLAPKEREAVFKRLYKSTLQILKSQGNFSVGSSRRIQTGTQKAMQKSPSYIGVCDVPNRRLAMAIVHDFVKHNTNPNRKIMIGVMTHPIVLDPSLPVPEAVRREISSTFMKRNQISNGFIDDPHVLNTIHYADLYGPKGPRGVHEAPSIQKNLDLCVKYGGRNLHAIQLDVTWPKPDEIKAFRANHPKVSLVLQVGKFSTSALNNDPQRIVSQLREYGKSIDYALLDMSMGKGKAMTSGTLLPLLRLIKSEIPNMGLAVAGGLGPEHSKELEQIAREFPDISIDTQGRVKPDSTPRDSRGHFFATDSANARKTREYLRNHLAVLDRNYF
jgi:hypothetical protein